ncbi:hypothetical protein BRARA_A00253 [Brassica rapa]|uniref:Uncharacterized protein n=1 Tax=Brassica campestris TaxID=3711 RepID=A0A398AHQ3_BRACM|nr:hypothetical protein BRARA_A00253 [Brassica rapa]
MSRGVLVNYRAKEGALHLRRVASGEGVGESSSNRQKQTVFSPYDSSPCIVFFSLLSFRRRRTNLQEDVKSKSISVTFLNASI